MRLNCSRIIVAVSAACLFMTVVGCSTSTNTHDEKALGPMPNSPPAGSPYAKNAAASANAASMDQSQFLAKLQQLPSGQRAAFAQSNSSVVSEIMNGTDESAKKIVSSAMAGSR